MIADPKDCEVCSVIIILNAKNVKPIEIHRQPAEVYCENVFSNGIVRKGIRSHSMIGATIFITIHTWSGQPSVVNEDMSSRVGAAVAWVAPVLLIRRSYSPGFVMSSHKPPFSSGTLHWRHLSLMKAQTSRF
ncbi:hypothetical protein TNCV_2250511 [Trichonephila clavipes]|nr:hypothetical protein TNCV_2250511 [Trichonephila clavipes]